MKLGTAKDQDGLSLEDFEGHTSGLVALVGRQVLRGDRHGVGGLVGRLVGIFGQKNVYLEVPDLNLDSIIATNEDVHKEIDKSWKQQTDFIQEHTDRKSNLFEEVDAEYNQFKRDAQKEVSYLVKEFECKKAASAYARAATSRTGVLDTARPHTYKFNEDLFKKVTVLPDGKNHGLVFILDWSGSMQYVLQDTLRQLYNLIGFVRKFRFLLKFMLLLKSGIVRYKIMKLMSIFPVRFRCIMKRKKDLF